MASTDRLSIDANERTPLVARDEEDNENEQPNKTNRWPSFVALGILCIAVIFAIVFGFAAPAAVEEYAKEAITFEPTDISIASFTDNGVKVHVQGIFYLDGSKVRRRPIRDLGRAAMWIVGEVESSDTVVNVYAQDYADALIGTVQIPPIKLHTRESDDTAIDIVANVEPGGVEGIKKLAHDIMAGKQSLTVKAVASTSVKSGMFDLGQKTITHLRTLHRTGDTKLPKIDMANFEVSEFGTPGNPEGLIVTADVSSANPLPIKFDIPPLVFEAMLMDCAEQPLALGVMQTELIHVIPKERINTAVTGRVKQLPTALTQECPNSSSSPLDSFIRSYLEGRNTTVYVRGGQQDNERTPDWIGNILREMVIPVPVPSRRFENTIRDFSLSDVHFSLPEDPDSYPVISALINVVVGLPKDIDVDIMVDRVRANADVFFQGEKMGELNLHEWQKSTSQKIGDELHVQSEVKDAPLNVTDNEVFSGVIQHLLWSGKGASLSVHANVDVSTATALGTFVVRNIPSDGKIFIKPIGGHKQEFKHEVKSIDVVGSTEEEVILQATVDVINPTNYSAHIPHVNISVWCNETSLGHAWGSFDVGPGTNEVVVQASLGHSMVGSELLSQYISGRNTSLTLRTQDGGIPGLPNPNLSIAVPMPHLFGTFMRETTMHLLSSTATFVLFSPLPMIITSMVAHAYYNGTDIGTIEYDQPIDIQAGENETPNLPVNWNLNGGFGIIRDALGKGLKLDAHADVSLRIGEWETNVWYEAHGMGAKVKLLME
ncbi:hypothetical protein R6Q59_010091 [Mikania micrantha]